MKELDACPYIAWPPKKFADDWLAFRGSEAACVDPPSISSDPRDIPLWEHLRIAQAAGARATAQTLCQLEPDSDDFPLWENLQKARAAGARATAQTLFELSSPNPSVVTSVSASSALPVAA